MIQETIIGDLQKNGFDLVSVAEPDLLQDDSSRKLTRQIFGAIAEYEKTMIMLKLRGARVRVAADVLRRSLSWSWQTIARRVPRAKRRSRSAS
jgi:hypothetical protein